MSGKAAKAVAGSTLPKSSLAGREIANSDDLLAEILLLLPLKLLIRFKFVSKHWLSLISHPVFASNYSTRNPSSPSISGLYIYTQFRLASVSFRGNRNLLPSICFLEGLEGKYSSTTIQHSCNGLMLFDTRYLNPYGSTLTLYIVCNPTTQNYRILPITRLSPRFSYLYRGAHLVFNPSKSPHYKVVVVSRYEEESFEIDVYSSETQSWKNIDIDVNNLGSVDWKEIFLLQSFSCSCGEAIYWLSYRSSLLKFDVHTEKMLTLPLPEGTIILPEHTFKYIGVCGGSLILIQKLLIPAKKLVILELDIKSCQGVTWVLKYRVDLRTIVSAFPEIEDDFKYSVLCFLEGEEKEDYSLVLAIPGRVISYNLNRRTFYVLGDLVPVPGVISPQRGSMTRKSTSSKRTKPIPGATSSEISPAAESIANNVDLLTEILLRLPAKSLVRFESVSKHWLSVISCPQFSTAHSSRNPSPSVSGLYSYEISSSDYSRRLITVSLHGPGNLPSLRFVDGPGGTRSKPRIEHSLNGLLLFSHYDDESETISYIVCNPTTQKRTVLSRGWISKAPHDGFLAFDPSKSPHYKVVLISMSTSRPYCVDVYSSHDASWDYVFVEDKCCYSDGVFWNGAIHWLSDESGLLRFDVDAGEMIALPNPRNPKILAYDKILYFGECGGRLVLLQSPSCFPMGFGILELEKDYSGWSVKCRVNLRRLRNEFPETDKVSYMFPGFRVLYVSKGEKEKDFVVVLAIPGRIISYKLKSRTWDVLPGLFPSESYDGGAYPFVESLFPV
ncbi:hypothetical protein RHSIM_Rhsim01G0016900 [Rhododendron simsii]|uniref:F-box domain-containing protein n=1 Tax=Rhododendron simsii TaxID=118357 RepID=A0A834HHA1_RHOSS|nr:hypothetical protein RHSIM_Rhsim01G0016900 [Rhododendron simsii]